MSINLILNQTAVLYGCSLSFFVCVCVCVCVRLCVCAACVFVCTAIAIYIFLVPLGLPVYIITIIFPLDQVT